MSRRKRQATAEALLRRRITQAKRRAHQAVRHLELVARLTGKSLHEAQRVRNEMYARAIVRDARRRGIKDACWHSQWGLFSPGDYARGKCSVYDEEGTWPMIWKVAREWGVASGAGNPFNHQVTIGKAFQD